MTARVGGDMQPITYWQDAKPFAGRVVAYKTKSAHYFGGDTKYTVNGTYFGYVRPYVDNWRGVQYQEKGYELGKLLKPKSPPNVSALIYCRLRSKISMRLATKEETHLIRKLIRDNKAKFDGILIGERVDSILDRHLRQLEEKGSCVQLRQ